MIENKLLNVQTPSRYLGYELNSTHKNWYSTKLHLALAFPDLYEIGTSHFGVQILYNILNNRPNTLAERVYAPANDMEKIMRLEGFDLYSLESKTPLNRFDLIGFSLLYELNYTNVLNMLSLSRIPFMSAQRDSQYPLLVAGGPCTFNPEPVSAFFDALLIGDGEESFLEMINALEKWIDSGSLDKNRLFEEWIKIKGVYIPSFFIASYDSNGCQKLKPKYDNYRKIQKTIVSDLAKTPLSSKPIVPFGKPVHDRLRIELSRGCTRGCRFCQAGMIYRPVRERPPENIIELVTNSVAATGYDDLSLLSLSTGDYCCILPLLEQLIEYGIENNMAISLPSLRAETLSPEIMKLIKKVRKTGFTIAPEAGSQRLRDVINKNISERDIINAVNSALSLGWKVIKLYFMVGLPTENQKDLESIVYLVKKLNLLRKSLSRKAKINVSVTTFVPKAHTPFQWIKQTDLKTSKMKIDWLRKKLKLPGIHFKWQDPHVSFIEGLFARGDRRSAKLLVDAFEMGCKFDSWSDYFSFSKWEKVLKRNYQGKTHNFNSPDTPLPWDHIKTGIDKNFFLTELEKSLLGKITPDCRHNECQNCGVCNFKTIKPVLHHHSRIETNKRTLQKHKHEMYKRIDIYFSKMNNGKYFGHLEMIKIFHRSLKRAEIPVKYSEGFHPSPKVSFADALPIGIESKKELMTITVPSSFATRSIKRKLNKGLPSGLNILACQTRIATIKDAKMKEKEIDYLIVLKTNSFSENKLNIFLSKETALLTIKTKKGDYVKYDLKEIVKSIKICDEKTLKILISTQKERILRPKPILNSIFELDENQVEYAKIMKL